MRNLIGCKLADLASARIQHRFIRDATQDFYLLPEEALENADSAIKLAERTEALSPEECAAIQKFSAIFYSLEPDVSKKDFFDTDQGWITLRSAARECLEQFGFDLARYENEEIERCQL